MRLSKQKKRIVFLLPAFDRGPVGGYKVIYEYANRLTGNGHEVVLAFSYLSKYSRYVAGVCRHPVLYVRKYFRYRSEKEKIESEIRKWFDLNERVLLQPVFCFMPWHAWRFGRASIYVATYIWTAICLSRFWSSSQNKYYFIQDKEDWDGFSTEQMKATYRLRLRKIVISNWLRELVESVGETAALVPNGLDFSYFRMERPFEDRIVTQVAMLWHKDVRKSTADVVSALKIVYERHPDLRVTAFGVDEPPKDLPSWMSYCRRPDRRRHNAIYNEASIFVAASVQEGWGLTASEAMMCGAALVCTDIGGYRSFATDGETALMSPPHRPELLAANVCRMIEDDALRIRIARKGNECIRQFTWDRAVKGLEEALNVRG